jgi:hypothetical protein
MRKDKFPLVRSHDAEPRPSPTDSSHRRVSAGAGTGPIALLRDIDQPYIFEIKMGGKAFRLEFYDNNSPENWRLLRPDLVVLCYDISQRLSLINMQRQVRSPFPALSH